MLISESNFSTRQPYWLLACAIVLGGCAGMPETTTPSGFPNSWRLQQEWPLEEPVQDAAIASDGSFVLLSALNHVDLRGIQRLDIATGAVATLLPQAYAPKSLAISPDGTRIAGSWPGAIGILSVDGELVQEISHMDGAQQRWFSDIAFTPSGYDLVGTSDSVAWLSVELGDFTHEREVPSQRSGNLAMLDNDVVVVEQNTEIRLIHINEADPRCIVEVEHPGDVAISPDGRQFATARNRAGFTVWNIDDCSVANEWSDDGYAPAIAWLPDNRHLLTGSISGAVKFWDSRTGELVHTLDAHGEGAVTFVISPDARTLVTIGQSGKRSAKLWRAEE